MHSKVELSELSSDKLPDEVPYAVITPEGKGPFPLCVLLMGGGGSRQSLIECRPLFEHWWAEGVLAPMVFAAPSAGMSYYVEDGAGGVRWDGFIVEDFIPHLRKSCKVREDQTAITGISMGGYGALRWRSRIRRSSSWWRR